MALKDRDINTRRYAAGARDVKRERPLEVEVADSSARVEAWLAAEQTSPSQRAEREEEVVALADDCSVQQRPRWR